LDAGSELAGGQLGGGEQNRVGDTLRAPPCQVDGLIADHPGPGEIDRTCVEGLPYLRETLAELEGQVDLHLGCPAGEGEGGPNL